jgi:hypothetical protein
MYVCMCMCVWSGLTASPVVATYYICIHAYICVYSCMCVCVLCIRLGHTTCKSKQRNSNTHTRARSLSLSVTTFRYTTTSHTHTHTPLSMPWWDSHTHTHTHTHLYPCPGGTATQYRHPAASPTPHHPRSCTPPCHIIIHSVTSSYIVSHHQRLIIHVRAHRPVCERERDREREPVCERERDREREPVTDDTGGPEFDLISNTLATH